MGIEQVHVAFVTRTTGIIYIINQAADRGADRGADTKRNMLGHILSS